MNEYRNYKSYLLVSLVFLVTCVYIDQAVAQQATVDVSEGKLALRADQTAEGVEILTRGPVHEAFAETVTFNPEAGVSAPKAPPEAIEELPPDQRPAGSHVVWVPGYWAWDDERNDFLWVSGIWRAMPPGRQWVPGYWSESSRGNQWTSGYWGDADVTEVEYLPAPPASVESGPNSAAPAADYSWQPGNWIWYQSRYAWRPGYWAAVQPNWVWTPAYYVWSPRGYIFVNGYWDYSIARRGVLFAPVYFNRNVYARSGFNFLPTVVINPLVLMTHLFLRPNYQHYYFGDYYAASYANAGFYPWFAVNSTRFGYDPIFAEALWQNRQNRAWVQKLQADFQNRQANEDARPPRTLVAQQSRVKADAAAAEQNEIAVATTLTQLSKVQENPLRLQSVAQDERQNFAKHGQDIQKFRKERQKVELKVAAAKPAEQPDQPSQPTKVTLPPSPFVAKAGAQAGKDQTPPKRHEVLKPDLQVIPKPATKDAAPKVEPKADRKANPKVEPKPEPEKKVDRLPQPKDLPKPDAPSKPPKKEKPQSPPKDERSKS